MGKDEFTDFCERVGGKEGWFPNGKTSVTLEKEKWDPAYGVACCKIVRPAGPDEKYFRLYRSDVNTGIRACREQRKLLNTGELKRAGVRSWAASPLNGLLKLYFGPIAFSWKVLK